MVQSRLGKGMRVAIVEDDPLLRESLALFFRARGWVVETYGSAEDSARALEGARFDMVICNFPLPGEDGLSVLRRVREECGNVVTVLMTAHAVEGLEEETMRTGVDGFLPKPFSTKELEGTLKRMFERRTERTAASSSGSEKRTGSGYL